MSVREIEGESRGPAGRFALVAARFNSEIVEPLVMGAIDGLVQNGVPTDHITLVRVPGSFELPLTAKRLATSGKYSAVIALGAVIKGDTDHYEYVCEAATHGLTQAALDTGIPIMFGVLTCGTEELAKERAGGVHGNKGFDCALAALEMVNVLKKL